MKQNKKYIILSIMVFVIIMTTNIIISLNIYDNYNKKETNDKYLVIGNIINSNNVILIANKDKMGELPNLIEKIKCDKELKKYL